MVSVDYLGPATLKDTKRRRELLWASKLFHCECPRCNEWPDITRGLPCPDCLQKAGLHRDHDGLLPAHWQTNSKAFNIGTVYRHPQAVSKVVGEHKALGSPWKCSSCMQSFGDDDLGEVVLEREEMLCSLVDGLDERFSSPDPPVWDDLVKAWATCLRYVGLEHWTLRRIEFLLIERVVWDVQLGHDTAEGVVDHLEVCAHSSFPSQQQSFVHTSNFFFFFLPSPNKSGEHYGCLGMAR